MKNLPTQEQIAARAYELWHAHGCQHGNHEQDWHDAEAELIAEHQSHQWDDDGGTQPVIFDENAPV
jgi:hypothetical protein